MNNIHYRGQKFKKRLSKEQLKVIASDQFQKIGMDKYVQCNILSKLCDNVESSKNPKFFSLISSPKNRNSISWIRAYSLVMKYLEEFKMTSTLKTINKEMKGFKISFDFDFFKSFLPSQFLTNSIKVQKRNRKKFSVRVSSFKMPPPLIIDENIFSNNDDLFSISIQKKKGLPKNNATTKIRNDFENDDASYISGDENSHFNVSSIDVIADD